MAGSGNTPYGHAVDPVLNDGDGLDVGMVDQGENNRRNQHKEVERKRRQDIHEKIMKLGEMVPGYEKAKGEVLQRVINYIEQLRAREQHQLEQGVIDRIKLQDEIQRLKSEIAKLKGR